MSVLIERDALEQVVQAFGCQRLRLQQFSEEQERLMEHAIRLCPGGRVAPEIIEWPPHKAASQNLHNPCRQESELGYFSHHPENSGVAREHANLSTKAFEPPKDEYTARAHRVVSFGDSPCSEFHDDIGSQRLGAGSLTKSSAKWPEQNSANQKLHNPCRQESELEDFSQTSSNEALAREQSNASNMVAPTTKVELTPRKQKHPTVENSRLSLSDGIGSQITGLKRLTSSTYAALFTTKSIHSAIGLGDDNRAALNTSESVKSADSLSRIYEVTGKSLYGETPISFSSIGEATRCARALTILASIVTSGKFESLCAAVILANSVVMGISADYAMKHLNGPDNEILENLEIFFSIFYTVEVCLRMVVYGRTFFTGSLWKWNLFDVLLIFLSIYDRAHMIFVAKSTSQGQRFSIFRLPRLFKMLRLLRVIRLMNFFRELRLILAALHGSIQSMLWAGLLVALVTYVVAIGLMQGCEGLLEDGQVDINIEQSIGEHWSSVGRSMISLFMCTTGGEDWANLAAPLEEVGTLFYALFLAYVFFFLLAVMNTITSLFVDSIMESSLRDKHMEIQMELEKKHQYIDNLKSFFERVDEDGDGIVSYADFIKHSDDPVLEAFAASLDLDITSSQLFFKIISNDGVKPVDVETFVVGCIKLKGHARNMDLIDLIHTTKNAAARQDAVAENMFRQIGKLEALVSSTGGEQSSPCKLCSAISTALQDNPLLQGMLQLQKRMDKLIQQQSAMVTLSSRMQMLPPQASREHWIQDAPVDGNGASRGNCGSKTSLNPTGRQIQPGKDEMPTPPVDFANGPLNSKAPGFSAALER